MSGSVAQSLGNVTLIWGGTTLNVDAKSSSFTIGGLVAKPVIAGQQVTQAQDFVAPMVKASFPLLKGMSITGLRALNGSELQVQCDTGQTYTVTGAFIVGDPQVKGGQGNNVSISWSGQSASEVVS